MEITKENFEEAMIKYYLTNGYDYTKMQNILSEAYYENIKKHIEQNTNIFSVFHYETISLFAIKNDISYWLVCEIYSKKYAIINSNKEIILPFDYYNDISTTEDGEYIICNERILFDFTGKLVSSNFLKNFVKNNNNPYQILDKKLALITEIAKSSEHYPLKCFVKYFSEKINALISDIKNLENSCVPHSIFDYNGSLFFADGDHINKYFALKEKNGNKWGLINFEAKLLSPFIYDDLGGFTVGEGNFIHMGILDKEGYKVGLLDCQGNVVIKPISEGTVIFSEGLARIYKNGKYGYIDMADNIVIPVIYDTASDFKYGRAMVELNNETFCINKKGERL